jgi:hypothetical protein
MSASKTLSEISAPFTQQMEAYLKQHQKAVLVCVAVIILICALIYVSSRNSSNHSIEAFNHSPVKKEA